MHSNRERASRCAAAILLIFGSASLSVGCEDDAGAIPSPSAGMGGSTSSPDDDAQGSAASGGGASDDGSGGGSGASMLGTGETGPDIGGVNGGSGGSAGETDPMCALDFDFDGTNDCEDGCPNDGQKIAAGECGCGIPDTDIDADGTLDCEDGCAADAAKIEAGECGCGRPDVDSDGDGPLDCDEECPRDATRTLEGPCGCGAPDDLALCLRHRYSFDETGATAIDSAGEADGVIVNTTATGNGSLVLAGGETDQFVDLPDGIISSLGSSATIEIWLTWTGAGGPWQRIFDFGSSEQNAGIQGGGVTYLFVTPANTINTHLRAAFTNAAPPAERPIDGPTALPFGVPVHVALTVDSAANAMQLYLNGVSVGTTDLLETTLVGLNDVNNWIGRSQFVADEELQATLEEVRIYSVARSAEQILAEVEAGPDTLPDE
jgi:hypothetical protein